MYVCMYVHIYIYYYTANVVDKDLDMFAVGAVSLYHIV
jgi:hypothetical protein